MDTPTGQTPDQPNHGNIVPIKIEDEMRGAYLDYAMSVIIGRALPDVRDGLKPVHRRALFAMYDLGNSSDKPYKKSARVVGDVIGKYHPHGDSAVYDTIVRMAQDFSLRYPLVDGQGNFGSVDGDAAAAMRYTEVRMEKITNELLADLEKETVDFGPNYDESLKEPLVMPARFPNLLVNGSTGIAVGMATNILPHNLTEVINACLHLIHHPDAGVSDLLQFIKGPDFPTGATIYAGANLKRAYHTGRGGIICRAKTDIEPMKGGRERIVITEIPFQVNKSRVIERIAELVKQKRIEGISDLRDESDRDGLRVVIDVKKNENANVLLNKLFKMTQLQDSFSMNMLAIHQNRPKLFNLKDMLWAFIEHRKDVIRRRTAFELKKAQARAHLLEGLKVAVENIDEVVKLIKAAANPQVARQGLMERFELTERQAQAILDMRLHRLTGLERDKIVEEYKKILLTIDRLKAILASEALVYEITESELKEVLEKYGDERRSEIVMDESEEFVIEDLIADEPTFVSITHTGYIVRSDLSEFRAQGRGGKGLKGMDLVEGDFVKSVFKTTTLTNLLCFTTLGRMHVVKVYKVPEGSRTSKGKALVNLIQLAPEEKVVTVLPMKGFSEKQFVVLATKKGLIKKTKLSDFKNVRANGICAIQVMEGDALLPAKVTDGTNDFLMSTRSGQVIRFSEEDVRSTGRTSRGVRGITLSATDEVVSIETLRHEGEDEDSVILTLSELGFGKRTFANEYRRSGRGGKGIRGLKVTGRVGRVIGIVQVYSDQELFVVSSRGTVIRIPVKDISIVGRVSEGVTLMKVSAGETVVTFEAFSPEDETAGDA